MGRAWDKFCLLFWKNWLLQRKNLVQFFVEILVPVFFCSLLLVIRSLVAVDKIKVDTIYEPFSPDYLPTPPILLGNDSITSRSREFSYVVVDVPDKPDPPSDDIVQHVCNCIASLSRRKGTKSRKTRGRLRSLINSKLNNDWENAHQNRLQQMMEDDPNSCFPTSSGISDQFNLTSWILLWSPNIPEVDSVMKAASNSLPVIGCGVKDSNTLKQYLTNPLPILNKPPTAVMIGGVVFPDDLPTTSNLPYTMNVSIRFPSERRFSQADSSDPSDSGSGQQNAGIALKTWNTGYVFPLYQSPGPRVRHDAYGGGPGYYQEGFLGVENAVLSSLLNYYKQKNPTVPVPKLDIEMKRFPYPSFIDDPLLQAMEGFIPVIIMLSFLYTAVSTVRTVTTEKEKQLKEAMKMMGLPNWLHWTAWFVKTLILYLISVVLILILIKAPLVGGDLRVFPNSDWSCVLAFLFVYSVASITLCFAISTFFSKASTGAVVSGMLWFICYLPYFFLQERYVNTGLGTKLTASLLSNTGMAYGFQITLMYEGTGIGLQWSNLWTPVTSDDSLTMGHVMGFLLLDAVIYMCLAIYIEAVFPGDYGVPLPWNFPFQKSYWLAEKAQNYVDPEDDSAMSRRDIYEKEPRHLPAGVQIKKLRKVYNKDKVAVNDLTLNMYEGQITVLLGHNGAGKTTTMSMLTGLFTPTAGTALVGGHDIRTDIQGVRETLGLCPQHNVLFDELTVKEHLRFFGKLKGLSAEEIKEETDKYLELLNLEDKGDSQAKALSGGMQRKLAAAVALCGKSKVVLFDEPTSGMDPSARRSLWDLLQGEKEGRTILLTTHFMDEADLLGDRIAIMSEGKLQCCGSSFFLKKKYGGGYYLVIVKDKDCVPDEITNFLKKYIPNVFIKSNIGSELSYNLEEKYSEKFEEMFTDLEGRKNDLGILSYGVSLTTLEEVFMKVGSEAEIKEKEDDIEELALPASKTNGAHNGFALDMKQNSLLTGFKLFSNQVIAMFTKYVTATYRSWLLYIIIILIPILDLTLSILVAKSLQGTDDLPTRALTLQDFPQGVVSLALASKTNTAKQLTETYKSFIKSQNTVLRDLNEMTLDPDIDKYILDQSKIEVGTVSQTFVLGTLFDQPDESSPLKITGWFNNQPYHLPPVALSYIYNSVFRLFDQNALVTISNQPLPYTAESKILLERTGGNVGFQIAFNLGFSFAFISSYFLVFYIRERVCKAKLLQFVSGVNVFTFWTTGYIWNFISFLGPILAVIITLAAFQQEGFSSFEELGRCFLIMMCCSFAILPLAYLGSFLFETPAIGFARMIFFNVFTGLAAFIVVMVLQSPSLDLVDVANTLDWIFTFLPSYSLTYSISNLNRNTLMQDACKSVVHFCEKPNFINPCCSEASKCPESGCVPWTNDYFAWESPGVGRNILIFLFDGIVLFALLLVIEHRVWEMIAYKGLGEKKHEDTGEAKDSDVLAENESVKHISEDKRKNYNLLLQDVTKYYKNFLAVNGLNLAVERGECFGLLGVNGAGKTSTFKMLTGDEKISSGDAYVNGLSLKYQMKQVNQLIGYCPQFDALLDDLTGRETLRLFCLLRGVPRYEIKMTSEKLARELLFYKHIDKKVKEYSGGNKRKLSTAVALIGDPPVVYLDEPTTGMDPVAKRHLWDVICKVRNQGKTIILTSHSMEECEALCTRLAIMVNGEFKCLGSTQHLKTKFAQGYTLSIKVRKSMVIHRDSGEPGQSQQHRRQRSSMSVRKLQRQDSVYSQTELEPVKNYVQDHFEGAVLREEYQGLLTYHIPTIHITWARMFGLMESAKRQLNIEDYSLGQTSLEQVFLSFTKFQLNRNNPE